MTTAVSRQFRTTAQRVVASIVGIAAIACAPDQNSHASDAPDGAVVVILDDIRYEPDEIVLSTAEPTTLYLVNEGGIVHDLVTDNADSGMIRPGRSAIMQIGPITEPVVAWCSVPGHRDAGMQLLLVPSA